MEDTKDLSQVDEAFMEIRGAVSYKEGLLFTTERLFCQQQHCPAQTKLTIIKILL